MGLNNYNIGILAAMDSEYRLIHNSLEGLVEEKVFDTIFCLGKIKGNNVVLVRSGVGKVNAATATTILIDHFECELIINTGIAGGISPTKTRDVILSEALVYNDVDVTNFGYSYGQIPGMPKKFIVNPEILLEMKYILNKLNINYKVGVIASGDKFAVSEDIIKNNEDKILAVDMEGCAIAQVATKAGVEFVVLRFISDIVGAESQIDNYSLFEEEMSLNSSKITLSLLEALE